MAKLDPTVFNSLRPIIDDLTQAAHELVQRLDAEIQVATASDKKGLQHYRDLAAELGYRLDSSDPDADVDADADTDLMTTWGLSKVA